MTAISKPVIPPFEGEGRIKRLGTKKEDSELLRLKKKRILTVNISLTTASASGE